MPEPSPQTEPDLTARRYEDAKHNAIRGGSVLFARYLLFA